MTDETKISRRYRELAREEPPREIDEAILAAARRATDVRPAPLVVPSGRRRWYFPLAAAAVIVLAVAVTVHVERQSRDVEVAEAPVAAQQEKTAAAQAPAEPPRSFTLDPKPEPRQELRAQRKAEVRADDVQKPQPAPAAPAPAAEASGRRDAVGEMRETPQARAAMRPMAEPTAGAVSRFPAASPEQWLQGIDDLKRQGKHEEAERELAEFRKRYPDYRIPEAITEKFERR
jgi:hypothetical protein